MTTVDNEFKQKLSNKYYCSVCDYGTCRKNNFDTHNNSNKHKNNVLTTNDNEIKQVLSKNYQCQNCSKDFNDRAGLWRHKKTCNEVNKEEEEYEFKEQDVNEDNFKITSKMFYDLLKQNNELQKSLIEMSKERGPIINTNNNNCNNKTFNLQVYLNETCKDAINLTDFVDSIKVQIKDLEKVGEKGYAQGISDIFINNLQQLNTHSRPIHCSDSKRETLYIKDENHWTKDDEQKTTLTKAIKQVANKNIKQISEWQKQNPEYKDPESKQNDKYMNIVLNSMSGSTNEEANKNYEKIIKNVIKETIIDK